MYTRQEMFGIVVRHLLTQNAKSERLPGFCLYRGPNGLKCAIGALIPDDIYRPGMEDVSVTQLPLDDKLWAGADLRFLECLQSIHDNWKPERWRDRLMQAAEGYNLIWPEDL